jgi:hypothetical protein
MDSKYFNVNFVKYPGRLADPLFRLSKDEVLLTAAPGFIFLSILIAKYLFTGSLKK